MGIVMRLKNFYKYLYGTENYSLKEDEKICENCAGTGHEDIFHDCEKCAGTGVVRKG